MCILFLIINYVVKHVTCNELLICNTRSVALTCFYFDSWLQMLFFSLSLFLLGNTWCPDYSKQKCKLKVTESRGTRSPGECEKAGLLLSGRLVILLLLVRWSDNKSQSALQHRPRLICPPPQPCFSCFTNPALTFTCLFHSKQLLPCACVNYYMPPVNFFLTTTIAACLYYSLYMSSALLICNK